MSIKLKNLGQSINAISTSHNNHIACLGNFARHDVKNAILSIDSILTVTEPGDFDNEKIQSLGVNLSVIRNIMDDFARLVPYSSNGKFKVETLFIAVDLLTRASLVNEHIILKLIFDRNSDIELNAPFQSLLQMINNLIINSIKALENYTDKNIVLEGKSEYNLFIIRISDNGASIDNSIKENIFEYGFSTTGGSGIGLYHAKYMCDSLGGEVFLDPELEVGMSKTFKIVLPIT
jgi:signal transduction histidine kinase